MASNILTSKIEGQVVNLDVPPAEQTTDEPWVGPDDVPWYRASCQFVINNLACSFNGRRGHCLVVGSPLFEVQALRNLGWFVTQLDVRDPSQRVADVFIRGDALRLPFSDNSYDAISSTCLVCHVGLGRYGDEIADDGDKRSLAEMYRVLAPQGRLAIMLGPSIPILEESVEIGNTHRIYSPDDALTMVTSVGFVCLDSKIWCKDGWLTDEGLEEHKHKAMTQLRSGRKEIIQHCYLSMLLTKE